MKGRRYILGLVVSLVAVCGSVPAYAQQPADSVRQHALAAFHGPDGQGKDGPLASVGFDLALLYAQWQAHQARGETESFSASGVLPVRNGRVTIDATAARDPAVLRDSLEALGLTNSAQAGMVVSGRFPIASIPAAAALANLRAMRPARAMTQRPPMGIDRVPDPQPDSASNSTVRPDSTEDHTPSNRSAVADHSPSLYWVGGAVFLVVGLLFFLLWRTP